MAFFYGINSNYAGNLFSSFGNQSGTSGLSGLLAEYSSIKNGSYGKLLHKYYGMENEGSNKLSNDKSYHRTDETDGKNKNTSLSKDSTKTLNAIEKSTDELKESADKLIKVGSGSVFQKVTQTDKEGNTTRTYDTDKIYSAVKEFVDDYNSVLTNTAESNVSAINSNVKSMKSTTQANKSLLSDLGISVDEKGKLSVDEEKFKKADMSTAKSLFNGTGSYAYQVSAKSSMINYNAERESSKANTYTNKGAYSYNYSSGDLYNSLF